MTRAVRPRHAATGWHPRLAGPSSRRGSGDRRSMTDWLRGLMSVLLLTALLIGVPAALIALRGNPLPDTGLDPSGAGIDALTSPDDGSLFLGAVTWLAWAGWASVRPQRAGRDARANPWPTQSHLPATRAAAAHRQRTRRRRRAADQPATDCPPSPALGAVHLTLASVSRSHPRAAPTSSNHQPSCSSRSRPHSRCGVEPRQHAGSRTHTVRPGDSLWQIATDHLGDGTRFTEIAQLNYGLPQPDGHALAADHWLRPGWTLRLPDAATTTTTTASRTQSPTASVTVQPGDTLWDIAQDTLGDGARYPEIAAASTGPQPDGEQLTDPDLIRPGWHLTLPHTAASPTPQRPGPRPHPPPPATAEPPRPEHRATAPIASSTPPAPAARAR